MTSQELTDGLVSGSFSEAEVQVAERVLSALDIGLIVFDVDGVPVRANDAAYRILGTGGTGRDAASVWDENWPVLSESGRPLVPEARPHATAARTGGAATNVVIGVTTPHRAAVWLLVSTRPLLPSSGRMFVSTEPTPPTEGRYAVCMTFSDVSAQQRNVLATANDEVRYQACFDNATIGMAIIDLHGSVTHANETFARMRGCSIPEMLRQNWEDGIHPEDVAAARAYLEQMRRRERSWFALEYRYRRADGSDGRAIGTCSRIIGRRGKPIGFFVQMVDITSQREAEAALAARNERFRLLTLATPVGVFELDEACCYIHVTPRWSEITGVAEPDAIGCSPIAFVHREDAPTVAHLFEEATLTATEWQTPFRCALPGGGYRSVVARAVPRLAQGKVIGWLGTLTDITEWQAHRDEATATEQRYQQLTAQHARERLESQLAQSQRFEAVGRLAGGVAHDFNNLLGVITNYATFLARQQDLPANLAGDVAQIHAAAARGAELTRQLLLFSRREQLRPQLFDLSTAVWDLSELMSRPLRPKIDLTVESDADLYVLADRGQISQLLLNLVINARDAMVDGGRVTITANRMSLRTGDAALGELPAGPYARIRVADDGPGMAPEVVAQAFQPFFTTKARTEASGLGLATVQGIAEQSGGRAFITSTVGVGTTVTVVIPAQDPPPAIRPLVVNAP